jgi:4-oxalocrotonate tautomerase
MPHVIVKLWPGKSEQEKKKLADEITKTVMTTPNYGKNPCPLRFEEVESKDWTEKVYKPDILGKPDTIYKKPGYNPL